MGESAERGLEGRVGSVNGGEVNICTAGARG